MSAPSRRRNGSQASCEPCRKGKIRCDHQKPICGSCRRRRLESQCWYHPAPLTKRRASQQLTPTSPLTQRSNESRAVQDPDEPVDSTFQRPAGREPSFKTWPFMSSFSTETPPLPVLYEIYDERTKAEQLAQTEEIVTQLKDLSVIERIIHEYYSFAQVALVRKPILMKLLELLCKSPVTAPFVTGQRSSEDLRRLAQNVLRTTASPVTVVESLDVEGFCSLFCGKSLRIEVLGCLYALAARISLYRLSEDPDRTDDFIRRMTRCAQLSNRLFREVSSQPNDVSIWMAHEVMGLTDLMEGDASLRAWRQIGDMSTDLYAFGLNREASYTTDSAPFFLRETRREVFVRIYHIDKLYASVFNRPPQLSSRFKDCRAPFDLPDDVLFSSDYAALIRERDELTDDGWNKDQGYRNTTWARMRYIMADFMEETCECQFRTIQPSDHPKLRDISRRCHAAWNALPSHLRYTPDCWHSKLARNACLILAKAYLQFLHIQFQLYRLIDEGSPPSPELLRTSSAMLKTVVQIEKVLPRAFSSPRELPGMILCYGMPTAVILVSALQDALQDPSKTLPPGLSKSSIIRNLSVLICQLETATHQEEANHNVCIQAAKALSRKLDQILDESAVPEPVTPTSADASAGHTVPALSTPAHAVPIGVGQATDLDAVLLNPTFDDFDLENWAVDLDLGAANSGWEMF